MGDKRANLECGDGHSSLVVCVFVFVERSCASTDLFFGVVTSGDGRGRRASALGVEQPLKITGGDGSGGFFAAGMESEGLSSCSACLSWRLKHPGLLVLWF